MSVADSRGSPLPWGEGKGTYYLTTYIGGGCGAGVGTSKSGGYIGASGMCDGCTGMTMGWSAGVRIPDCANNPGDGAEGFMGPRALQWGHGLGAELRPQQWTMEWAG
eukprot:scaffold20934_cov116-Isochrysis_galbana.AAC.8